ncbi:hypothetical protein KHP32_22875, partial [Cronobacter sakazakii]|uniref:hypothetical protein n=1 Tax=Cronobacter sakazakii TaxID=28141 RepID=UPI001BCC4D60
MATEGGPNVLERIGRNLLVYQQVEQILKRVIPYIHPRGSALGVEALRRLQMQVNRRSLGDVIEVFAEAIEGDSKEVSAELKALVRARNDLVHHLLLLPGVDLLSEHGRRRAADYLDAQFEAAQRVKDSTLP